MSELAENILILVSNEVDELYGRAEGIFEEYALETISYETGRTPMKERPKFHWRLARGKHSVKAYWLEREFIRNRSGWKRFHKHLPLHGKDEYAMRVFKKAPEWEFEAIELAEAQLAKIRKRCRILTEIVRACNSYRKSDVEVSK